MTDFDTQPQRARSKPRRHYSYSRAHWENLNVETLNITERINKMDEEKTSIDIMWKEFKTLLVSAIEETSPHTLNGETTTTHGSANRSTSAQEKEKTV